MNADEDSVGRKVELHVPVSARNDVYVYLPVLMVWTLRVVTALASFEDVRNLLRADLARLKQILYIDVGPALVDEFAGQQAGDHPPFYV